MQKLILIKLGGSVVTFKDRPLSANTEAIDKISAVLGRINAPAIIVHGGGSFGHYWSVQFDMHTNPARFDPQGIAIVHESMVALNQIIVNSMIKHGLNPYALQPSVFTSGHKPILSRIKNVLSMAKSNVLPVTFGDVVHFERSRYSILSGDAIMTILAQILKPSRVLFATNVDGIYSNLHSKTVVSRIDVTTKLEAIKISAGGVVDVTGGMQRKIIEAFKIASSGMDVMILNGLYPERILEAAEGRPTTGSLITRRRSRS
jgi:isopentenyl phosphate kinase